MDIDAHIAEVSPLSLPEIVAFPDEVDITNAEAIGSQVTAAIGTGVAVVIADMTRTVFCDSSGVGCLLLASRQAAAAGAELRLVVESGTVLRILRTIGADLLLRIYPTLQAALNGAPASGRAGKSVV